MIFLKGTAATALLFVFASVAGCDTNSASLAEQWRAECVAEGFGSRTTGLAACIAKRRSIYIDESLSVPANL